MLRSFGCLDGKDVVTLRDLTSPLTILNDAEANHMSFGRRHMRGGATASSSLGHGSPSTGELRMTGHQEIIASCIQNPSEPLLAHPASTCLNTLLINLPRWFAGGLLACWMRFHSVSRYSRSAAPLSRASSGFMFYGKQHRGGTRQASGGFNNVCGTHEKKCKKEKEGRQRSR